MREGSASCRWGTWNYSSVALVTRTCCLSSSFFTGILRGRIRSARAQLPQVFFFLGLFT